MAKIQAKVIERYKTLKAEDWQNEQGYLSSWGGKVVDNRGLNRRIRRR